MNSGRILVVDDSKTQLLRVQMAFEALGFTVLTAEDGLSGVSRALHELPDLIISDVLMPELNGYQLCRLLKNDRSTAHIPILLLTSLDARRDEFWGIHAGADQYLIKSSDLSELEAAVLQRILIPNKGKANSPGPNQTPQKIEWKLMKANINHFLDSLLFESTLKNEIRHLSHLMHDREALLREMVALVRSVLDYDGLVLLLNGAGGPKCLFDLSEPLDAESLTRIKTEVFKTWDVPEPRLVPKAEFFEGSVALGEMTMEMKSRQICPLEITGDRIGVLAVFSKKKQAFSAKTEAIIQTLATELATVFKLMLLYEETRELSITDSLTQLYNKRYFLELFEKEFRRAKRFDNKLSLIMLDIDYFKRVNDTHGHLQGDRVLQLIGQIIKKGTRQVDIAARYGGEEFVIVTPNTDIHATRILADKIRTQTESQAFLAAGAPIRITVSLGVATLQADFENKLDLIKLADDALYRAKAGGRNQVCLGY